MKMAGGWDPLARIPSGSPPARLLMPGYIRGGDKQALAGEDQVRVARTEPGAVGPEKSVVGLAHRPGLPAPGVSGRHRPQGFPRPHDVRAPARRAGPDGNRNGRSLSYRDNRSDGGGPFPQVGRYRRSGATGGELRGADGGVHRGVRGGGDGDGNRRGSDGAGRHGRRRDDNRGRQCRRSPSYRPSPLAPGRQVFACVVGCVAQHIVNISKTVPVFKGCLLDKFFGKKWKFFLRGAPGWGKVVENKQPIPGLPARLCL